MKYIVILSGLLFAASLIWWLVPSALPLLASPILTNDEINACATMVAIDDYRRDFGNNASTSLPFKRTREDAIQSLIVDMGEHPDFIAVAASYARQFSIPTVYSRYVEDGTKLCIAMKMRGEKIEMPPLKVADGYHVTRSNGSAALVKDGDPEPIFGCMEGYRPTGTGCVPQ
jgi:hypothetical protein